MLREEPLSLDFEHILRIVELSASSTAVPENFLICVWAPGLGVSLTEATFLSPACVWAQSMTSVDFSQSGTYCFPFLMKILILPLIAWFLSCFF